MFKNILQPDIKDPNKIYKSYFDHEVFRFKIDQI